MAGSGCPRVRTSRELHACDLLGGRGKLARIDNTGLRFTPEQRAEILMDGLRIIENAAHWPGGIEVDNVCLRKANVKGYERSVWTGCSTASTRPFIFPNSSPDHRVCNFLTPFQCPHAVHPCPSVDSGLATLYVGTALRMGQFVGQTRGARR